MYEELHVNADGESTYCNEIVYNVRSAEKVRRKLVHAFMHKS